jgi:hypothetical protein
MTKYPKKNRESECHSTLFLKSLTGLSGTSGPAVCEGAADDELQGMIDHYGHQDEADGRVAGEDELGHWDAGGQGFFGAAENGGDAVVLRETQGVADCANRPHDDEEKQDRANEDDEESAFAVARPDMPFHGIAKGRVYEQQDGAAIEAVDEFFVACRPLAEQGAHELAGDQRKDQPKHEVEDYFAEMQGVAAGFEFRANPERSQEDTDETGESGIEYCNRNVASRCCGECNGGGNSRWKRAEKKETEAQLRSEPAFQWPEQQESQQRKKQKCGCLNDQMNRPAQGARFECAEGKGDAVPEENESDAEFGQEFRMQNAAVSARIWEEPGQQNGNCHSNQKPIRFELHRLGMLSVCFQGIKKHMLSAGIGLMLLDVTT